MDEIVRQAKVYAKDHDIGNLTILPTQLNDLEKVSEIMTITNMDTSTTLSSH